MSGDTDVRREVLRASWQPFAALLPRLEKNASDELIHDARVAARRLRALLRSTREECNPAIYAQLKFDLTNLGRELGDVRAADVRARLVDSLLAIHPLPNEHDHRGLRKLLERMTDSARRRLEKRLAEDSWNDRIERIRESLQLQELVLRPRRDAAEEIREMLLVGFRKGLRALNRTTPTPPSLHKARIEIKCARYAAEILLPQLDIKGRRTLAGLHEAQDILGEIHDLAELIDWLKRFAVPTPLHDLLIERATLKYEKQVKRYFRSTSTLRKRLRALKGQVRQSGRD